MWVVVAGESEDAVAGGGQGGVFGAVVSERLSGAVGLEAVELDDDAVLGPVVVGFAVAVAGGVERVVGLRVGEPGLAQERQELGFPFVLGSLGGAAGGAGQDVGAAVSVGAGDRGVDGAVVVEVQARGLRQRALEL
jgi:hypothetical protein